MMGLAVPLKVDGTLLSVVFDSACRVSKVNRINGGDIENRYTKIK